MLTLAYPWLLALLPLPLLVWWLTPPHREPRQGLVVPFLARLAEHSGQRPAEGAVVMRGAPCAPSSAQSIIARLKASLSAIVEKRP